MSYIYTALKPHLCKDVIGIIEDMVRWEGDANFIHHQHGYVTYGKSYVTYGKKEIIIKSNIVSVYYNDNLIGSNQDTHIYEIDGNLLMINKSLQINKCLISRPLHGYNSYDVVKINDNLCAFIWHLGSRTIIDFVNNLQYIYDKHLTTIGKKNFLYLNPLLNE